VSEVFFKMYRNLHHYRQEHAFSTWLYRLAANHVLDHRRRSRGQRQRSAMPEQVTDPQPVPSAVLEHSERSGLVRSALEQVTPRYREVLFLVYVEGLPLVQVGQLLGLPQGTVKSRLMRGRQALRRLLLRRNPELFES
jgi:RNA polymerase sigma-70 factor (ECF subfamily)